jgi:putative transcriptional regulator
MSTRLFTLPSLLLAAALACGCGSLHAQIESAHAFLLVAKEGMPDGNFAETVVLAVRADEGGPIGVILNRPGDVELRSLYPDRPEVAQRPDLIFLGGPIEPDALLFAFRSAHRPAKGLFVAQDIYISGFSEVLAEVLKHPENAGQQRFFTGFSGWAAGQLEDEIAQGGWYVLPFDAKAVFDMNPLTMYRDLLERAKTPLIETSGGARIAGTRLR